MTRDAMIASAFALFALPVTACDDHTEGVTAAEVAETEVSTTETTATADDPAKERLTIDRARSSVGFTGAKVSDAHEGRFGDFEGAIELDPDAPERSRVSVTIQMASVDIEPERLEGHLLSADFFDVERFPTATFESTRIAQGGQGTVGGDRATHTITGNLTLHGETRAISFPAIVTVTGGEVRARSEFKIDRKDFGIVYPGMPDDLISDDVVIRFDVRAPRSEVT